MVEGTCLCGAVRIELDEPPLEVTSCDCSSCRRRGALWCYASPRRARAVGPTATYQRPSPCLTTHHCPTCGCTTHWSPIDPALDRMGLNARLLDPAVLRAARVRIVRGSDDSWAERLIDAPDGLFP